MRNGRPINAKLPEYSLLDYSVQEMQRIDAHKKIESEISSHPAPSVVAVCSSSRSSSSSLLRQCKGELCCAAQKSSSSSRSSSRDGFDESLKHDGIDGSDGGSEPLESNRRVQPSWVVVGAALAAGVFVGSSAVLLWTQSKA